MFLITDQAAWMIVAYALVMAFLSLSVVFKYRTKSICFNSHIFVAFAGVGLTMALYYIGLIERLDQYSMDDFIRYGRMVRIFIITVLTLLCIIALIKRGSPSIKDGINDLRHTNNDNED